MLLGGATALSVVLAAVAGDIRSKAGISSIIGVGLLLLLWALYSVAEKDVVRRSPWFPQYFKVGRWGEPIQRKYLSSPFHT